MSYTQESRIAATAVRMAAELCAAVRAEMVSGDVLTKNDKSPVTVADFGSQALVCHCLKNFFPADAIVAEEDSQSLRQPEQAALLDRVMHYVRRFHQDAAAADILEWIDAGRGTVGQRFWTLDPIDGTKGFLRNDQYAVALALIDDGQVQVAALACPAQQMPACDGAPAVTGVLYTAVRGEGALMRPLTDGLPTSIRVVSEGSGLRFVESVEAAHGDQHTQEVVAQAVGITETALRMDSQAKYGAVARGDAALYLRLPSPRSPDYREKIWDHAAGALVVEEAGGRVSDMTGRPLDFASHSSMRDQRGVVVSNGVLHDAAISALSQLT